jgi:hypothetical protein
MEKEEPAMSSFDPYEPAEPIETDRTLVTTSSVQIVVQALLFGAPGRVRNGRRARYGAHHGPVTQWC